MLTAVSAGPAATTRPSASSSAWVVDEGSSSRWCVTSTDATSGCVTASRSMASSNCSRAAMSSPVEGSSSSSNRGSQISARAISTRPRSPCDRIGQRRQALPSRPSEAMSASARSDSSADGFQRSAVSMVPVSPVSTTSRTVSAERSGWRGLTWPITRRSACSSTRPSCDPSTCTVPAVGKVTAPQNPRMVLLPAPLGPSSAQCSPRLTVKETPRMISLPSLRYVTSRSSSTASGADVCRCTPRLEGNRSWKVR